MRLEYIIRYHSVDRVYIRHVIRHIPYLYYTARSVMSLAAFFERNAIETGGDITMDP